MDTAQGKAAADADLGEEGGVVEPGALEARRAREGRSPEGDRPAEPGAAEVRVRVEGHRVERREPVEVRLAEGGVPAEPRLAEQRVAADVDQLERAMPPDVRAVHGQLAGEQRLAEGDVAGEAGAEERREVVEPGTVEGGVAREDDLAEPRRPGEPRQVEPRPAQAVAARVQDARQQILAEERSAQVQALAGGEPEQGVVPLAGRQVRQAAAVRLPRDADAPGRGAARPPADVQGEGLRRRRHAKVIPDAG